MRKIILVAIVCMFVALSGLMVQWLLPSARTQERPSTLLSAAHVNISDQELEAFAKVYVAYHRLQRAYEPSLRNARTAQERKKIQQEANSKLEKVLQREGLTPETYNKIFKAVNADEKLRKKGLKLINEQRRKS
jgi:hypothetical protein